MILSCFVLICKILLIGTSLINYKQFLALNETCIKTWTFFEFHYNVSRVSREDYHERKLEICNFPDSTCCYQNIEPKLVDSANKKFFKSQFFATLQPIRNSFVELTTNFDYLVKESLEKSFHELILLLNNSDAGHVEKNGRIISDFYSSLKSYFSEYQINLSEILSKTFLNLFTANLNSTIPQHNISYSCLVKNFHLIKPFGADIISEMESQIKLSLESAKFFSTGLTRARDILLEIMNKLENPSKECQKMITTMTSCSLCTSDEFYHEKINIKPCYQTCIQAYKTCFSIDLAKFDNIWSSFLVLMNKLSFHIEFTVNFPNTVNEIKYQLIDGIAYFNTNRHIIVSELLEACQNYTNRDIFFESNSSKFSYNKRYISSNGLDMHKYFFKVMNFLKEINGMWKFLISDVCKAITPKSNKDNCWSGTSFKNQIKSYKESSSVNEWSKDNPVQLKKTLNRQGEILKFFNKKLYKYLNKKIKKKNIFFKNSNIFTHKKFMEESTKQDMVKLKSDYIYKEYVKKGRIYDNMNQMRNLYNNEEFYYDYGEYYYDQNEYENDYIDIGDEFPEINNPNSIKQQLSKQKNNMFMYNTLSKGYSIEIKKCYFIIFIFCHIFFFQIKF